MSCRVTFLPHEIEIEVAPGTSIIQAALDARVHINASCGGEGVCGKCRVRIEEGAVEGGVSEKLSAEDLAQGYRLACQALVTGDCRVRIPVESALDAGVLARRPPPRRTARVQRFDFEELKEQGLFLAPVEKIFLELPPPSARDNQPDASRLIGYLTRERGEHRLEVDLPVIRKLPSVLREAGFRVTATLVRPVREDGRTRLINVQPGDATRSGFAVAIDVGTTTVCGELIDLATGATLAEHADFNAQISYGEDVISRIVYAEKPGGLERLQEVVVGTLNTILKKLIRRSGVDPEDIATIALAGNTTMTQLLLRIDPRPLRRAPYVPAASIYPPFKARDVGLKVGDHVTALVYPCVSSYVGGDIVAGVMGSGLYRSEALTLFLDVGTNAEIVIGNRDWLVCAACSAGPAFEGGGIRFGMRAARGAIEEVAVDPTTLEPMIVTIGRVRPKGICGSGLISAVAVLFEAGVIDNRGKFDPALRTPRIREADGCREYVIARREETQIERDITLSEIDIENLIRAKGAIYSGCMTLLGEVGLGVGDIERIILAGGFGSYIDLEKAMTIGLLPEIDPARVTYLGNGSLLGAKMASLTNRVRRDVVAVVRRMTNFELSETPSYMDNYIAALFLPHTDIDRFPRVKARLAARRGEIREEPGNGAYLRT